MRKYKHLDTLPIGRASDEITEGCLVLEGGAWRGLYTVGVLDAMMENDINLRTTVGISAGGLSGVGYVSGQIGWGVRIDLSYRHDWNYCGLRAFFKEKGITGFNYLYKQILLDNPLDKKRLNDPSRRFIVGATNMLTGQTDFFEKGKCSLSRAVQASATVPYLSRPVVINGTPYMDGGCSTKVPYRWAVEDGQKKIVVVKTREREYRRKVSTPVIAKRMYKDYPSFVEAIPKAIQDAVPDRKECFHGAHLPYPRTCFTYNQITILLDFPRGLTTGIFLIPTIKTGALALFWHEFF